MKARDVRRCAAAEVDRRHQPVPRWACLGSIGALLAATASSIFFAYAGACGGGAGPGGWNIHLVVVWPIVVAIGLGAAGIAGATVAFLPWPRWVRVLLAIAVVTLGAYEAGSLLFGGLNGPIPSSRPR